MSYAAKDSVTVLFAGGGTGGHLIPGLSVAQELMRRSEDCKVMFAGSVTGMDKHMVERFGFGFMAFPSTKWQGSFVRALSWGYDCGRAFVAARKAISKLKPDIIVSLGGYGAMAPAVAGLLHKIPLAIMEQNALPGKVNRLLSWRAREVYAPWPCSEYYFAHPKRVHITGNPLRRDLVQRRCRSLAVRFGLDPRKKTLLVMGGSQGAQFINRLMISALPMLEKEKSWLQILHSSGQLGYDEVREAYGRNGISAAVYPFIEDMATAYAVSDLSLCRAGGTTLAELTAVGVPAVLVPLPMAANDHQRRNASLVAGEGGALIADQADLTTARLAAILRDLLRNDACLARMRAASLRLGRPTATCTVVNHLLRLVRRQPPSEPSREFAASAAGGG